MIEQITEMQSLAQSGLAYCKDKFDIERYKRLLEIAADLLTLNSNHQYEEVLELFKKDRGYATPKIDVRAAVFIEDKVLLVQEQSDSLWSIPGGWADVNLSPAENVLKEIKEEAGMICSVVKLVAILDKRKNEALAKKWPHIYKMIFLCQIASAKRFRFDKNEVLHVDFFPLNHLPPLSEQRINNEQINLCYKHWQDLSLPTVFD